MTDQETDITTDREVDELLRHIEPEQLHQFIAGYAARNKKFKKDMFTHFRPQDPQKTIDDYRAAAASCFEFGRKGRYPRGYDFYQAAYEAELALYSLLEKGKYLSAQSNFKEAAAIAQSIVETIPRFYETVDDSNGGLGGVFNDAIDLLLKILENGQAGKMLKVEIFHWAGKETKEKIYGDYGFDEIESLLIPGTLAAGLVNEALDIAEERIKLATSDYRLEKATMDKIRLLEKTGMHNEVMITINESLGLTNVRKLKVDMLLEKGLHAEAILLIKEGIRLAEEKKLPGLASDWKDQLLDICMTLNDHKKIIKLAEDLFYNGRNAMKYYHLLKKETKPDDWAARLEALIAKQKDGRTNYNLPEIYIEEKYWDRLLHLVKDTDIRTLERYEKYLRPHFPDELSGLLVQKITEYAESNTGRGHYEYVARTINNLRSYPHGNGVADKLLVEFRAKYKARRAMLEELKRA